MESLGEAATMESLGDLDGLCGAAGAARRGGDALVRVVAARMWIALMVAARHGGLALVRAVAARMWIVSMVVGSMLV